MGSDPRRAVVDGELRVHGIGGLRVADASVVPSPTSGTLSSTTVMIGEKISDVIKKAYSVICEQ